MPPTMGRPLVVSSTVFRSLGGLVEIVQQVIEREGNVFGERFLPSEKTTAAVPVVAAASEKSCHFDMVWFSDKY
jgi:hypothetical protein